MSVKLSGSVVCPGQLLKLVDPESSGMPIGPEGGFLQE